MLKAAIIDDEIRSIQLLQNLLRDYCDNVKVVGTASSVDEGYQLIQNNDIDILFLDIEMQQDTGFDLLDKVDSITFEIIFITAYSQYAIQAIKVNALDYLLKPIDIDELKVSILKVENRKFAGYTKFSQKEDIPITSSRPLQEEKLVLSTQKGLWLKSPNEIIFLKSDRQYTIFHFKDGSTIMTSKNLGEYEPILIKHGFIRPHHSYLINLQEITQFNNNEGPTLHLSDGSCVPVSKRRKEKLWQSLKRN